MNNATICSDKLNAEGVYITLNPVSRDVLARSANELTFFAKNTTADSEIIERWLPIDLIPNVMREFRGCRGLA